MMSPLCWSVIQAIRMNRESGVVAADPFCLSQRPSKCPALLPPGLKIRPGWRFQQPPKMNLSAVNCYGPFTAAQRRSVIFAESSLV